MSNDETPHSKKKKPGLPSIPADTVWIRDACPAKPTPFLTLEIKEKMNTCFKALSKGETSKTLQNMPLWHKDYF